MTENRSKCIESRRESGGKPLKSLKMASVIAHGRWGGKTLNNMKHTNLTFYWLAALMLTTDLMVYSRKNCTCSTRVIFFDVLDGIGLLGTCRMSMSLRQTRVFEGIESWKMLTHNCSLSEFHEHVCFL